MWTSSPTPPSASLRITLTLPDGTVIEQTKALQTLGNPRYWAKDAGELVSSMWQTIRAAVVSIHGEPPA